MAFKLTKAEIKERDKLLADAREAFLVLHAERESFNDLLVTQQTKVEQALDSYNERLGLIRAFVQDIVVEPHQADFDDKDEKWQESAKGEAAQVWIEAWESLDIEERDIDFPEHLEEFESDVLDAIEACPTDVNGG